MFHWYSDMRETVRYIGTGTEHFYSDHRTAMPGSQINTVTNKISCAVQAWHGAYIDEIGTVTLSTELLR